MVEQYDYASATYNSPNPLRRFAHRSRFERSKNLLNLQGHERILDYGCGDGLFLHRLAAIFPETQLSGFEPFLENAFPESEGRVRFFNNFETALETAGEGGFECVTCFEVLEHFNAAKQQAMLDDFVRALHPGGRLLISVPVEIGFPALVKNLMRVRLFRPPLEGLTLKNVLSATFLHPPKAYRQQEGYLTHAGFDFRALEKMLQLRFSVEHRVFSPFPALGFQFNSQVFWVCKKLKKT